MSMHRLRPPPFYAPGRRGRRAGDPGCAVLGGWSWGHNRARRRCTRRHRTRAWRLRWQRSGVGPSRRANRRTSAWLVRFRDGRSWLDHLGTGSWFDPVVIQPIQQVGKLLNLQSLVAVTAGTARREDRRRVTAEGGREAPQHAILSHFLRFPTEPRAVTRGRNHRRGVRERRPECRG